ncbi:MAG: DUF1553 domain-containing protein [Pirellulales bacterium]
MNRWLTAFLIWGGLAVSWAQGADAVDFNRDIRPILSNKCFRCHGPDEAERKGGENGLRFDTANGWLEDLGGYAAVVPGKPDESELIARIKADDADSVMPPPSLGKPLTPREVELLEQWVADGAKYSRHWSYVKPARPELPEVKAADWARGPLDLFVLARLEREGLAPSPEADRAALARRVALDLTGLPPTAEALDAFLADSSPDAYEKYVDQLLASPAYGEHWARMWLDLARYADSAGYADDPLRTIWAFRDYAIRSFNANKPFDQFTVEQIAGDLLPNPTEEQLMATAFHRNTQTNSEGGTIDEEFRNVAIVDRVNTTMSVWMGTTMACAQCHTHKYDPITNAEYFRFFAFFNNTADADRPDESPLLSFYTGEQKQRRSTLDGQIAALEKTLTTPTPELYVAQGRWEQAFPREVSWHKLGSAKVQSTAEATLTADAAGVQSQATRKDTYSLDLPESLPRLSALRLTTAGAPAAEGDRLALTGLELELQPPESVRPAGRYVRIELPGKERILSLAEVQVFRGEENLAAKGTATQSSTTFGGDAKQAIDGVTDGQFAEHATTHTAESQDPWWEVDLGAALPIDAITVWNRTDFSVGDRLKGARILLLDANRQPLWQRTLDEAPAVSERLAVDGRRRLEIAATVAEPAANVDWPALLGKGVKLEAGWPLAGAGERTLLLALAQPIDVPPGSKLSLVFAQASAGRQAEAARFQIEFTADAGAAQWTQHPPEVVRALRADPAQRSPADRELLTKHFLRHVAAEFAAERGQLESAQQQLAEIKPNTVPYMQELAEGSRRKTHVQLRGNYLNLAEEVTEGVPVAFHPLAEGAPRNRLALAQWLVSPENPLTARVTVNRYWEKIFGTGLVATSEDFGLQGDMPSHPELLDWLAVDLQEHGWDLKRLLRQLVTSAAYRQSCAVTPEQFERDPENRLLARGPRNRLDAEVVRDQALSVAGLLSHKMFGPSVKPPQPNLGLSAAFGSGIDWETSAGEDRYRRGLYTAWRRSNPYPSMLTFDAPNREVCTVRRPRSNTPLQALVTLNDPVYIEAAQALARRMIAEGGASTADRLAFGFRTCLTRLPSAAELERLTTLYDDLRARYAGDEPLARSLATDPIGPPPEGVAIADLAAWTAVANVLLNLDEMFMSR